MSDALPAERREPPTEADWTAIAEALGVPPDSPILAEVSGMFGLYFAAKSGEGPPKGLDGRRLKRVREGFAQARAELEKLDDETWRGLFLRYWVDAAGDGEHWLKSVRNADGKRVVGTLDAFMDELKRLERAATPPRGAPPKNAERTLLLNLALVWRDVTDEWPVRRVSKPPKWGGRKTQYDESGPFREFLHVCRKAYGLENEWPWDWILREVASLTSDDFQFGDKSAGA